jgi:hypothetical protein
MNFYVRSSGNPADLLQPVRSEIRRAAVDNVVASVFTLQSIVDVIGQEILTAVYPMTPLIATGMLLSTAGIYGVLAFAVARRRRELAIRVAVGATAAQLVRLVATLSVRLVGLGILFGIGTTFGLSRFVQGPRRRIRLAALWCVPSTDDHRDCDWIACHVAAFPKSAFGEPRESAQNGVTNS